MLNVADAERAGLRLNRGLNETSLRAVRRFDLACPLLEFTISAAADGEEVIKPREKIMLAVVPPLGALLRNVVVILFRPGWAPYACLGATTMPKPSGKLRSWRSAAQRRRFGLTLV